MFHVIQVPQQKLVPPKTSASTSSSVLRRPQVQYFWVQCTTSSAVCRNKISMAAKINYLHMQ